VPACRAAAGLAAVAALVAGCGGTSSAAPDLSAACTRARATLPQLPAAPDLDDATRALRRVLGAEQRALADLRAGGLANDPLATRLRAAIVSTRRSLVSIEAADPQRTMAPIRTGVPNARRAAASAEALVTDLCRRARA
jgi:hypothetical protein